MHDEFTKELKFPLTVAAKMVFESEGIRSPSRATLCRWIRKGKFGVQLESKRFNGNYLTSVEAIRRFVAEVDRVTEPRDVRRDKRARELQGVADRLDDLGI